MRIRPRPALVVWGHQPSVFPVRDDFCNALASNTDRRWVTITTVFPACANDRSRSRYFQRWYYFVDGTLVEFSNDRVDYRVEDGRVERAA